MALTNFWMKLTSCSAIMLIYYGVILEAITQLVTGNVLAHGSKTNSVSWLQGLIRLKKNFFNSVNQLY